MNILEVDSDYDFAPTNRGFEDLPKHVQEDVRRMSKESGILLKEDESKENKE